MTLVFMLISVKLSVLLFSYLAISIDSTFISIVVKKLHTFVVVLQFNLALLLLLYKRTVKNNGGQL